MSASSSTAYRSVTDTAFSAASGFSGTSSFFLIFQRLKTENSSLALNFSIRIRNLAVCSDESQERIRSTHWSMLRDSLKIWRLHERSVSIDCLKFFFISRITGCSSNSFQFWSKSISRSQFIVSHSMFCTVSELSNFSSSYFQAASSSFLYLLIRLYLARSS